MVLEMVKFWDYKEHSPKIMGSKHGALKEQLILHLLALDLLASLRYRNQPKGTGPGERHCLASQNRSSMGKREVPQIAFLLSSSYVNPHICEVELEWLNRSNASEFSSVLQVYSKEKPPTICKLELAQGLFYTVLCGHYCLHLCRESP